MIEGSKNELDQIAATTACPEHPDAELTVAWNAQENSYVIKCRDHYPEEVKPVLTRTQLYKAGQIEAVDPSFNLLPRADLETGEVISPEKMTLLVAYARHYGLDPYRGHVVLMHGQPYVELEGYLYHANREKIPYSLTGRPLTPEEMAALMYDVGDIGWKSTVRRLDTGAEFEGWGFVKKSETTEKSRKHPDKLRYPVVADKPANMVVKRAEWQALRRAFPLGEEQNNRVEVKVNGKPE